MRPVFIRVSTLKHLRGKIDNQVMNESKSITSSCPCILISFLFFLMTKFFFMNVVVAKDQQKQILSDLLSPKDFKFYFNALEKTVNFCIRHKIYVDLNLDFGLFLVDVNLRNYTLQKNNNIPEKTRTRLKLLLSKIDDLTHYFHYMLKKNEDVKEYKRDFKIARLFYNASTWPRPSDKFNKDLLKQTKTFSLQQLKKMFGEWETYFKKVYDYDKYKPSPNVSDGCISAMGRAPPLRISSVCDVPAHCKKMIREGSQFGYGLSHRLLFMAIARFSLECVVVSAKEDKRVTDKYCSISFNEATYISLNNFQLPDLMFEQIALCGLFGHAQFYRNPWLRNLLQFQTSAGCFSELIGTKDFNKKQMREGKHDKWIIANFKGIMNGQCNGHFTAVATASLSHALRYIIETYYN